MRQVSGSVLSVKLTDVDYGSEVPVTPKLKELQHRLETISLTVPANSTAGSGTLNLGASVLTTGGTILVTPQVVLPTGLFFYAYKITASSYAIAFVNLTGSAIVLTSVQFGVTVFGFTVPS